MTFVVFLQMVVKLDLSRLSRSVAMKVGSCIIQRQLILGTVDWALCLP